MAFHPVVYISVYISQGLGQMQTVSATYQPVPSHKGPQLVTLNITFHHSYQLSHSHLITLDPPTLAENTMFSVLHLNHGKSA